MSDVIGRPIFDMISDNASARASFINYLINFKDTISAFSGEDGFISAVSPYLQQIGATDLISRVTTKKLCSEIDKMASIISDDSEKTSVVFAYHSNNTCTIVSFNFMTGQTHQISYNHVLCLDSLAAVMSFELWLESILKQAAEEQNAVIAKSLTLYLCGC